MIIIIIINRIMLKMTKKHLAIRLHKIKGHNLGQDTIHSGPTKGKNDMTGKLEGKCRNNK